MNSKEINQVFRRSIEDYHITDSIDSPLNNPYPDNDFKHILYEKNWVDTVQWHLEDIIRSPAISDKQLVEVKRKIDASNQRRTDLVELMDDYFYTEYKDVPLQDGARLNSETPAWLLDRMSILQLKIYHFHEQLLRKNVSEEHKQSVREKLAVLREQEKDMETCYDELISDLESGKKYMKVYRQMKMYNDPSLNPILYKE